MQSAVSELPAGGTRCSGAGGVLTLWTMQQVVQRGTGRQLGGNTRTCIWQGKQGLLTIT